MKKRKNLKNKNSPENEKSSPENSKIKKFNVVSNKKSEKFSMKMKNPAAKIQ